MYMHTILLEKVGLSYHLCRWYDPYPRLAFALQMLSLAPSTIQGQVARQLHCFLVEDWGATQTDRISNRVHLFSAGKRWYDANPDTAFTLELIKSSPQLLKNRVADRLLEILSKSSAKA